MSAGRPIMLGAGIAVSINISSIAPATAQPTDGKAVARQLFEGGRKLARANQWAEACPKFEASLRLNETPGTRLNLATCYEKIGKLASAWALFRDSADVALRDGDAPRRAYALERIAALLPRLPTLTIDGPATSLPGFEIARDGLTIDLAATLGIATYIDPGSHEVTATAPGFEPFRIVITVSEAQAEFVRIGELAPSKAPVQQPQARPQLQLKESAKSPVLRKPKQTRRLVEIGLVSGGVLLTGVGLSFGISANSSYNNAKALCGDKLLCETNETFEQGKYFRERALTRASFATAFVLAGVATATGGAILWITSTRRPRRETAVLPVITDRDLGVAVVGEF